MKGMIFLDDNFRIVELPTTPSKQTWEAFIERISYAFFDIPERMQWFHRTYYQFDEMNSLFDKVKPGLYSYDAEEDYWSTERDRDTIYKVGQIYASVNRLPLSGCEEE